MAGRVAQRIRMLSPRNKYHWYGVFMDKGQLIGLYTDLAVAQRIVRLYSKDHVMKIIDVVEEEPVTSESRVLEVYRPGETVEKYRATIYLTNIGSIPEVYITKDETHHYVFFRNYDAALSFAHYINTETGQKRIVWRLPIVEYVSTAEIVGTI